MIIVYIIIIPTLLTSFVTGSENVLHFSVFYPQTLLLPVVGLNYDRTLIHCEKSHEFIIYFKLHMLCAAHHIHKKRKDSLEGNLG